MLFLNWVFVFLPGIVPSSVVLTGFQVLSRVFLTWAITHSVREVGRPFLSFKPIRSVSFIKELTDCLPCW